jgi:hypothetical protein
MHTAEKRVYLKDLFSLGDMIDNDQYWSINKLCFSNLSFVSVKFNTRGQVSVGGTLAVPCERTKAA